MNSCHFTLRPIPWCYGVLTTQKADLGFLAVSLHSSVESCRRRFFGPVFSGLKAFSCYGLELNRPDSRNV